MPPNGLTMLPPPPPASPGRFYRPELDALRYFAFFCVFVHHGPGIYAQAHAPWWKVEAAHLFMLARAAGGFGMSMFFLLSSYLITELLCLERRNTGRVHLQAFYIRRILRIWPLYYFAVALAILLGKLIPEPYWLSHTAILSFVFFAVAWVPSGEASPFRVLWSIGIEEQFYLLWPVLAKNGGERTIRRASYVVIGVSFLTLIVFAGNGSRLWYNPFVEFLFFAIGALLSIGLQGRTWDIQRYSRWLMFGAGVMAWLLAQHVGHVSESTTPPPAWRDCTGYALAGIGCILIFLSILGIPQRAIPKRLLYLGKISYGLYVFHTTVYALTMRWLPPFSHAPLWTATVDAITLTMTTGIAILSYEYFEKFFLRLKSRFEFIKSR